MKIIIIISLALSIISCSTTQVYEGEKLDESKVAIIKGGSDLDFVSPAAVVIKEVDGVEISLGSNKVEVLPGKHRLKIACNMTSAGSFNDHYIEASVEAGKVYTLGLMVSRGSNKCEGVLIEK